MINFKNRFSILFLFLILFSIYLKSLFFNKKNNFINQLYFESPFLFIKKKICKNYDQILNTYLDNTFSASIIDNDGYIVGEFNQNILRTPASNMKLFSTAYVLNKLNVFDTFKTRILKDNKNNYYLLGSGDPDLDINDIKLLLNKIQFKESININLVEIKKSLFWPKGWTSNDKLYSYGSPVTQLALDSNSSQYKNIYYIKDNLLSYLEIKNPNIPINLSILDYDDFLLKKLKIVDQINSNTILSLVTLANAESHNFTAESLFKNASNTWHNHNYFKLKYWLKNKGLPVKNIFIEDASGLSRNNKITTNLIASFLYKMRFNNKYEFYSSSFSILGVRGTLSKKETNSQLVGKFFGKSGTLSNSLSLSGYLHKGDKVFSISIIQNSNKIENEKVFRLLSDIYEIDNCK